MKGHWLILAACVVAISCALPRGDIEKAASYLKRYPYWPTGWGAPPQSHEQRMLQNEAVAFAASHPRASLQAAREALGADAKVTPRVFAFLAFHRSPRFEPLFLEELARPDFTQSDYRHAVTVVQFLASIGSKRAVPGLIKLGEDERLRGHVVEALEKIGDPRAVPLLCRLAKGSYPHDAERIVRALGALGDREAIGPLCELMSDRKLRLELRTAAAWALAEIGDRRAIPALRGALRVCPEAREREALLWPLLVLAPEEAPQDVKAFGSLRMAAELPPSDAIPWLLEEFRKPRGENRGRAALELARLGERSIVPQLKEELLFPTWGSRHDDFLAALLELREPEATAFAQWLADVYQYDIATVVARHGAQAQLPLMRSAMDGRHHLESFLAVCRLGEACDAERVLSYCRKADWARQKGSEYVEDRLAALRFFAKHRVREALPIVCERLDDPSRQVRDEALRTLGVLGGGAEARLLIERLRRSPSSCIYGYAAEDALAAIGDRSVVPALEQMLEAGSPGERLSAAYALAELGDEAGRRFLLQALSRAPEAYDLGWPPVAWVADAIGCLGDRSLCEPLRLALQRCQDEPPRFALTQALVSLGDPAGVRMGLRYLEGDAQTDEKERLVKAIAARGEASPRECRALEKLALRGRDDLRIAAIRALGTIGDERSLRFLESYPIGRRRAVLAELHRATGQLKANPAVGAAALPLPKAEGGSFFERPMALKESAILRFIEVCDQVHKRNDWDDGRYGVSLRALRHVADPRAVPVLVDVVRRAGRRPLLYQGEVLGVQSADEEPTLAAEALARIGPPAVEPLAQAYEEGPWYVRQRVAKILGKIGGERAHQILARAAREHTEITKDKPIHAVQNTAVLESAIEAIGERKEPTLLPTLEAVIAQEGGLVRLSMCKALAQIGGPGACRILRRALDQKSSSDRSNAIRALKRIGSPEAIEALAAALDHPDRTTRTDALSALGQLGGEAPCKAIGRCLRSDDWVTRYGAIAVLKQTGGPAAVDVLVQALGHTEGATRRRIITALGDLGDKRAIPHLIPLVGTRSLLESLLPDEATVALRKLTGQALTSREQWQKWYDASLDKPPEKR